MKGSSRAQKQALLLAQAHNTTLPQNCDVCIIGGGASGMVAAITAAEAGAKAVVIEQKLQAAQSILATGNGRCNLANISLAPKHYNHPEFVAEVCGGSWLNDVLGFWNACGLRWTLEEDRLYPVSRQAASVRNVLLARAKRAGVIVACRRKVEQLEMHDGACTIKIADETREPAQYCSINTYTAIIAVGGGVSSHIAAGLNLKLVAESPILAPLACENSPLASLNGRRAQVIAHIYRNAFPQARERGEVLLRDYGISGIVCFNLSRHVQPDDVVTLDFAPDYNASELRQIADPQLSGTLVDGCLDGVLDPLIAAQIIKLARKQWGLANDTRADAPNPAVQADPLSYALSLAKSFPLRVSGIAHPELAQVIRGGLDIHQFEPTTLAIQSYPRLFACGEALDIDADCGGFNLAWAWKSGMVAGSAAAQLCAG